MTSLNVIRGACSHDCPDTCIWQVTVENGRAVGLQGDPDHPFTRGTLCAKVNHYLDRVYHPDRVLHPLRRTGAKGTARFERVSWESALDEIATRWRAMIHRHSATTILPYSFAGNQGVIQIGGLGSRFFSRMGASRLDRGLCGATATAGLAITNGSGIGIDPEHIRHSRFILLWGTNTIVTNLHLWPVIREARENGAKVVVIDPIRTRTAEAADWHLAPTPGSDAALALGMMHVIVRDGLHDTDYIQRYTTGFEALAGRLQEYPPERVSAITGLEAADIERLAREYATTRPSLVRPLIGLEHHHNGAMMFRTLACLPAITGAWRDRGGGLFRSSGALLGSCLNSNAVNRPDLEDTSLRRFNMAHLGRVLLDTTLDPPISSLFVWNTNPAGSTPNQRSILQGLAREDLFTVVHDLFVTDTARYADLVLPATSQIEH